MLMTVRMYPLYEVDKVWKWVENNYSDMKNDGVTPLFMSEQDYNSYISVMCHVQNGDSFADFIAKKVAPCPEVAFTRTITLLKPAFYSVTSSNLASLCRFLVPLKVNSKTVATVYEDMLKIEPPENVLPAYTALSLGEDDIIASYLAENRDAIRKFVSGRLEGMEGVKSIRINVMHRTKRLVPQDMWLSLQKKFARARYVPGVSEEYSLDWTELKKCCVHGTV